MFYKLLLPCVVLSGGLVGATAVAQAPQDDAPKMEAPVAPASDQFSDHQIKNFAKASIEVSEIAQNAALDETQKQQAMALAVRENGLDPQTFNAIGQETQNDVELLRKVQLAMVEAQQQRAQ